MNRKLKVILLCVWFGQLKIEFGQMDEESKVVFKFTVNLHVKKFLKMF